MGAVPLAVLRAGDLWRFTARVVRAEAGVVAGAAAVLAGVDHPAVPWPVPLHLLLLPRRLLQGLLGRSTVVRRRGASGRELLGRALVSPGAAERPPVLRLHCGHLPRPAGVGRVAGALVGRWRRRQGVRR